MKHTTISREMRNKNRKTMRNNKPKNSVSDKIKQNIMVQFLELLNMIKLFHWKTCSYSQHKSTDLLYEQLNKHIDKFIELLIIKDNKRIKMVNKKMNLIDINDETEFKSKIYEYREFLINMDTIFNKRSDSALISIKDDILVDINQFLYLMTFK